jgi:hypothetical protein
MIVDPAAQRVCQRSRLLIQFLKKEMRVPTLLCRFNIPRDLKRISLDRLALQRIKAHRIGSERNDFPVFDNKSPAGVSQESRNIRREEVFSIAQSDDEGGKVARTYDQIGHPCIHHPQGVRTSHASQRRPRCIDQRERRIRAASGEFILKQVRQYFSVSL